MRVVIVAIFLMMATRIGVSSSRLSISTPFAHGFAPATVNILIHTPTDDNNTRLCIEYTSDVGGAGRSCWSEMRAIRQHVLIGLAPGKYVVQAYLTRRDRTVPRSNTLTFEVLDPR